MVKRSVALIGIVLALICVAPRAMADDDDLRVFPPDSRPFGLSYGQWSVRWWEWALSIPASVNPAADNATVGAGALCGVGQQGPVWNLAGIFFPGPVQPTPTRTCIIPAGRAILVPIINGECSTAEGNGTTRAALRTCAIDQMRPVDILSAELDGVPLRDLDRFEFQSALFSLWMPANNILGLSGGPLTSRSVADGFFIMLEPLSVGAHTLHFQGGLKGVVAVDVTYHLHIVR